MLLLVSTIWVSTVKEPVAFEIVRLEKVRSSSPNLSPPSLKSAIISVRSKYPGYMTLAPTKIIEGFEKQSISFFLINHETPFGQSSILLPQPTISQRPSLLRRLFAYSALLAEVWQQDFQQYQWTDRLHSALNQFDL